MKRLVHTSGSGLAALLAMGVVAVALGGCTTKARIPVTGIEVPVPNIPLPALLRTENDLRSRSWTKAFDILHTRLAREYAYSEHKTIDWDALYAATAPEVAAAEAAKDPDGWYLALRKYFYAIPDGNIQFDPNEFMRGEAEGASAGLALTQLSDALLLALLGGFLMRTGDGEPGWITLWRGTEKLLAAIRGYVSMKNKCG